MIPLTPSLLIAAANSVVGTGHAGALAACCLQEVAGAGSAGSAITATLTIEHGEPVIRNAPWHTAFAHHLGYWSHYNCKTRISSWPLEPSASCMELAEQARARHILRAEAVAGDLFLLWSPARSEFVRAGIVTHVKRKKRIDQLGNPYQRVETIEGDTDPDQSVRGGAILRHKRHLSAACGDRFVRWTDLGGQVRVAVRRQQQATWPEAVQQPKAA